MSGLITGYDPKTQNFIDTDLFDVSKHVTQTSGVLEVGVSYTIIDFNTGDDFANVGGTNVTGNVFVATGTTPTTYTNGSTLAHYVTQSYTYAELKAGLGLGSKVYKALLTQSGTSAPVATVLVNTLSGTPVWSYDYVGGYILTLASAFPVAKTIMYISTKNSGNRECVISVGDGLNTILVDTVDLTGTGVDGVLSSTSIIIEVFP